METKTCIKCKQTLSLDDFFDVHKKNQKNRNKLPYCKKCWVHITNEGNAARKQKAVEYKGGKCEKCGYDKCIAALEFHHPDPTQKEFIISRKWSFEKIKNELDKCVLLCSNCHKEVHWDNKSLRKLG